MRRLLRNLIWIAIGVLTVWILCFLGFDSRLKIQHYTITSEKIQTPIRLLLLSDLHSCAYGEQQATLVDAIDRQAPDIILLGGDICDDVLPHDNTKVLLQGIADRYVCYYVTGNHEYWSGEIDDILQLFRSYGVHILNGSSDTVDCNGQSVNICGITDPDAIRYSNFKKSTEEQLESLKTVAANDNYTVLLAHRPELIEQYAVYGFDLVLSGHAHGGQWRIPGLINGIYAPNQGWFPPYAGGKYEVHGTTMIVSRGLARETTRIPRIFNRPELVVVDVTADI